MPRTLLLTGATGHVGTALLPRLVAGGGTRVLALVRARDEAHLALRQHRLREAAGSSEVLAIRGDVALPDLGLSAADREHVMSEADGILHSAASVRFDLPAETAARENLAATGHVLDLARALALRGRLSRYDHVSTCYVAGDRRGRVFEHECDEGQGFRNSYEWSKCQAEKLVRAAMAEGIPAAVHRPSIIVGDSRTGRTEAFNVVYWPLKLYLRGWWRTFPGRLDTLVDIVPVDFVAAAIDRLTRDPRTAGGTFHLAAGDEAPTVDALVAHVRSVAGGPPLRTVDQARYRRFVRPLLWPFFLTPRGRMVRRGGDAFMPYFTGNPLFDTTRAREALGPDLRPPPVTDYFDRIVRYAREKDFGRA